MSTRAVKWAWAQEVPDGFATRKLVLLAMAWHANWRSWKCWPGVLRIRAMTKLHRRTIEQALADLEASGLVKATGETAGSSHADVYQLAGRGTEYDTPDPELQGPGHPDESPARRAAPKPHPAMRMLTDGWCQDYKARFGQPYVWQKAQDGPAAARVLRSGVSPEAFLATARRAWDRLDLFWCKQASSLAGLAAKYPQVVAELEGAQKPKAGKAPPRLGFGNL